MSAEANKQKSKIEIKEAVEAALQYAGEIRDFLKVEPAETFELEELKLSDDMETWFVTLGYFVPKKARNSLEQALIAGVDKTVFSLPLERHYKIFEVDSLTGNVRAMKLREE